jgi:hypothetical protein
VKNFLNALSPPAEAPIPTTNGTAPSKSTFDTFDLPGTGEPDDTVLSCALAAYAAVRTLRQRNNIRMPLFQR